MPERLIELEEIARRLKFDGTDLRRSVRRVFDRHHVPLIKRGRNNFFATEAQYALLMERMECLQSEKKANGTTVEARSVSGRRSRGSKSTLRDAVNATLRKRTEPSSNANYSKNSSTAPPQERRD